MVDIDVQLQEKEKISLDENIRNISSTLVVSQFKPPAPISLNQYKGNNVYGIYIYIYIYDIYIYLYIYI